MIVEESEADDPSEELVAVTGAKGPYDVETLPPGNVLTEYVRDSGILKTLPSPNVVRKKKNKSVLCACETDAGREVCVKETSL